MASTNVKKARRKRHMFIAQNGKCAYCHIAHPIQDLTFDHVLRKRDGGTFTLGNLVLACWICNQMREPGKDIETIVKLYREKIIIEGKIP